MKRQFPALAGFLNIRLLLGVSLFLAGTYLAWMSFAANPTSGSISTASSPIAWDGTAAAGASATGEMTCVEQPGVQVNCDTFTLTVIGTPADWSGKDVKVEISWVVLASDYDLYVHKGSNAGPIIGQSTGSAPGTNEIVKIQAADLDASGTSVFTAHVVYSSAVAGDQYHGVASVETVAGGPTPTPEPIAKSQNWKINYHGQCCEGNLAASGNNTYVLLPVLVTGNIIEKSSNGGQSWTQKYPPAPVSFPFGIEGDMQAFGNEAIFFGTELGDVVIAHSVDQGETWTTTQTPIASAGNDQAWSYIGPFGDLRPGGALPTDKPYVLAGWMRIGTAAIFSFDGGLTWPIQTPLVGDDGSGPDHVVCHQNALPPPSPDPGDTRIANSLFARHKGGRHGTWGTDRKFHWAETASGTTLYTCETGDFGVTWTGNAHPIAPGPGSAFVVAHSAFDNNGTMYVLHGDKLYVSFNQGKTFAFTHTLPHFGNAGRSDSGSDQSFVVDCGTAHIALLENAGNGNGRVFYLRGAHVDSATPTWEQELVDEVGNVRLDFMYIVLDGNNIPTISYTTPTTQVTTASRNTGSGGCLIPTKVGSRKTHGGSTVFDVNLPLLGTPGVECRIGQGPNSNNHTVVFDFAIPVTFANASVTSTSGGTASIVTTSSPTTPSTEVTVTIAADDAQDVMVSLLGVNGAGITDTISVPMSILLGDVNATRLVDGNDVSAVQGQTRQPLDASNFRMDVNLTGLIDGNDVSLTQNHTRSSLKQTAVKSRTKSPQKYNDQRISRPSSSER